MRDDCLAKACGWIDARLDLFRERTTRDARWPPSLKSIAELGHAAILVGARGDEERAQRWLAHAWRAMRDGDAVLDLLAHSAPAIVLLAPFRAAGLVDEDVVATAAARARTMRSTPEEQLYVTAALGDRPAGILAARPPPWSLDLRAAYQLAHEVFYRTRWGLDAHVLDAAEATWLRTWLPVWSQDAMEQLDLDLLAELAIAAHGAGACAEVASWDALRGGQRDDGAMARPPSRRVDFGATGDRDFDEHHHSTLVAIMAWAVCHH
ncbi:MAG: DUF6895 family protein [Kofleriaceae bacterium]